MGKPTESSTGPPSAAMYFFFHETYTWYDSIGMSGTSNVPVPVFTSANPPYTFSTVIKSGGQSWWFGSQTAGQGVRAFNGTIWFFQDHGASTE